MQLETEGPLTVYVDRPRVLPLIGAAAGIAGLYHLYLAITGNGRLADGVIPTFMGMGLFLYTFRYDRHEFDVERHELRWSRRSLLGSSERRIAFDDIKGIQLQKSDQPSEGLHRLAVRTRKDSVPLSRDFTNNEASQRKVAETLEHLLQIERAA